MRKTPQLKCHECGMYIPSAEVPVVSVRGSSATICHRACVRPSPERQREIAAETLRSVSRVFGVPVSLLVSKNRGWSVAEARHCACHEMSVAGVSTAEIAKALGRDISTVRHSIKMHFRLAETCAKYREKAGRVSF